MNPASRYFGQFTERRFTIVGKGPTSYDFNMLSLCDGPIIFINDAVQLEKHLRADVVSFFFAHDINQLCWLNSKLRSIAVLAECNSVSSSGDEMLSADMLDADDGPQEVLTYRWCNAWRDYPCDSVRLLSSTDLYIGTATIHTAIHFAYLCGSRLLSFIGCDGIGDKYDSRLDIKSNAPSRGFNQRIRMRQDWITNALRMRVDFP